MLPLAIIVEKPGTPKIKGHARLLQKIVPRTRVELVISALKGRRPRPLDERGSHIVLVVAFEPTQGLYPIAGALSS